MRGNTGLQLKRPAALASTGQNGSVSGNHSKPVGQRPDASLQLYVDRVLAALLAIDREMTGCSSHHVAEVEMAKKLAERRGTAMRALVLGSSLSALAMVGTPTVSLAQSSSLKEACAAVLTLRSREAIENLLINYGRSPCVPLLMAALNAQQLSRISPELVAELPRSQLRKIPSVVLEQLGLNGRLGDPRGISVLEPGNHDPYGN
jgi:hypothetical protein